MGGTEVQAGADVALFKRGHEAIPVHLRPRGIDTDDKQVPGVFHGIVGKCQGPDLRISRNLSR